MTISHHHQRTSATGYKLTPVLIFLIIISATFCHASKTLLFSWGKNQYGQLGNGNTAVQYYPVAVNISGILSGNIIDLGLGGAHTFVLTDTGAMYAW
jgi:alpha-tubulin suppressor-like RCC1 family protein